VQPLEVGIVPIAGIAQPVIGDGQDLVRGLHHTPRQEGIVVPAMFVEIVADMQP
jgi:hypothetical protein